MPVTLCPPDHFVWDGRAAHRDHPWSNQKRVWHWNPPRTTTGGLQGDYSPRGLYYRYNKHTFLNQCIRLWAEEKWFLGFYRTCPQSYNVDTLDRTVGDRRHVVTVELAVRPVDIFSAGGSCELVFTEELEGQLSPETKEAVENGVCSSYLQGIREQNSFLLLQTHPALSVLPDCIICKPTGTSECFHRLLPPSGPLLGYPLLGVSSLIQSVKMEPGTSPAMVSACVSRCMLKVNRYGFLCLNCKLQDYQ